MTNVRPSSVEYVATRFPGGMLIQSAAERPVVDEIESGPVVVVDASASRGKSSGNASRKQLPMSSGVTAEWVQVGAPQESESPVHVFSAVKVTDMCKSGSVYAMSTVGDE